MQTTPPRELIVAIMDGGPRYDLPGAEVFPSSRSRSARPGLRLAAARNRGRGQGERRRAGVHLDLDCIPAAMLCVDYAQAAAGFGGLIMGEVMYLPGGATALGWTFADFDKVAVKHSDRRGPPPQGLEICEDYRCFWSLNFAIRRDAFVASGGFDEAYVGYGGEDTDFAKTLSMAGGQIAWLKGALAYHQYHPHHMPPIHHLDSVVRNAELFERKWGYRTMGHWLYAFRLMGLIDDRGRPIRILRQPDAADRALTGQLSHQPYANTATVIRKLEADLRQPA